MELRLSRSRAVQDTEVSSYTFKFIILGDTAVGKSCILSRFRGDHFSADHDVTVGVTFTTQIMHIGTAELKIQLWDTAGQEIYRAITRNYYRESHCAIIVCDLTNSRSFESMAQWVKDVQALAPSYCKIVLVGNKVDLPRAVSAAELDAFAVSNGYPVFEISAATGVNVRALFEECAMAVYTDRRVEEDAETTQLNQSGNSQGDSDEELTDRGCC
jgi:Ras-related protein Rab-2A